MTSALGRSSGTRSARIQGVLGTRRPNRVEGFGAAAAGYESAMFILGVILIILGALLSVPILYTIGVILAVIGLVLWVLGAMGRGIGGRAHYY